MMLLPWRSAPGTRTMPSSLPTWLNAHPIRWRFTASPAAFPFDRAMPVNTIFWSMTCSSKVSAPMDRPLMRGNSLALAAPRTHASGIASRTSAPESVLRKNAAAPGTSALARALRCSCALMKMHGVDRPLPTGAGELNARHAAELDVEDQTVELRMLAVREQGLRRGIRNRLKTRRPQEPAERSAQLFIVIDDGDVNGWL